MLDTALVNGTGTIGLVATNTLAQGDTREVGLDQLVTNGLTIYNAIPSMPFDEEALTIASGDTLFVYTDGLTDRRDAAGEFYSIERIGALLERMPDAKAGALYDAILADVSGFASTEEFRDDIAFVVTCFE